MPPPPDAAPRGLPFELRMALRYLTTRRREGPVAVVTLLCAGGVFTGVLALVLALALMAGLHGDIRARLLAANPHVVARPAPGRGAYTQAEASDVVARVRAFPGVVAAAPYASAPGLLRSTVVESPVFVEVKGIVPEGDVTGIASLTSSLAWKRLSEPWDDQATPRDGGRRAASAIEEAPGDEGPVLPDDEGPLTFEELKPPPAPAILLGQSLASRLGVSPGDLVVLVRGELADGNGLRATSRAFRVAGLLDVGIGELDEHWAVARIEALAPPGEPVHADGVEASLADPLASADVADALASSLGPGHEVNDWMTSFARLFAAFRFEKLIMGIALGLIGLVAGFNIFTILTLNVTARIADIGILGALGASAGTITRVYLWMGLLLGGIGTVAGLAGGSLLAWLLDRHQVVALDPGVYFVSHLSFRVEAGDLAVVAGGMLLVSLLATLAPARAAARLDPVVALRSA